MLVTMTDDNIKPFLFSLNMHMSDHTSMVHILPAIKSLQ